MNRLSSNFVCPDYDHLNFGYGYCSTQGCNGASAFGPEWDDVHDVWSVGLCCACGCANVTYVYFADSEEWELC